MYQSLWRISDLLNFIALYFHTLRHLKAKQIFGRLWFYLRRRRVDVSITPAVRVLSCMFKQPARRRPSLLDAERFLFLNKPGSLNDLGWDSSMAAKLWRYNQHYFDDLTAFDARERRDSHKALMSRWVEENPAPHGTGWEPYPTSLRIVNWIKWQFVGNKLPEVCVQSLALQTNWLCKHIEWHILGNHLFANAKALIFAGLFFSGDGSDRWLTKGLRILADELPKQTLADGGNFERSPMYHSIFLEDLLDLINLALAFPNNVPDQQVSSWIESAARMWIWLQAMSHPDGEIAFFNDAAIGVAPSPAELLAYAQRLGIAKTTLPTCPLAHFPDSGYIRVASAGAVALLDVARIGPDYLPGHAHADTLSFELSLLGQRVLVNGGTSEYATGCVRLLERSTASHNTVEINGENSSEVWGGFRVARRAYPRDLAIRKLDGTITVCCAHDGYCRLPGKPVHRRSWQFSGPSLVIADHVDGNMKNAYAYFHVHPGVEVCHVADDKWVLKLLAGERVLIIIEEGESALIESHHAPEFGQRLSAKCLRVALGDAGSRVRVSWSDKDA